VEQSRGGQLDGWGSAEEFFAALAGDDDPRGRMSAINLSLLRGSRPRWSNQVSCFPVMGICMGFKSAGAAFSEWVRVEPRLDGVSGPTVAVTLQSSGLVRPPMPHWEPVVGATICRVATAPAVLESFLLQIGDEQLADSTGPFWTSAGS
jgi:hypothetical protein